MRVALRWNCAGCSGSLYRWRYFLLRQATCDGAMLNNRAPASAFFGGSSRYRRAQRAAAPAGDASCCAQAADLAQTLSTILQRADAGRQVTNGGDRGVTAWRDA